MKRYFLYFLIQNEMIVYIGMSSDVTNRLKGHKLKQFDSVRSIECRSLLDAKRHEKRLIRKFKPILNIQCTRELSSLSNDGILIKVPKELKLHVNQYVTEKKVKGGLSGMVKRYLEKRTKFTKQLA